MTTQERKAYEQGGFREKYAMDHSKRKIEYWNGLEVWRYFYDKADEYQDANGATYEVKGKRWVG